MREGDWGVEVGGAGEQGPSAEAEAEGAVDVNVISGFLVVSGTLWA